VKVHKLAKAIGKALEREDNMYAACNDLSLLQLADGKEEEEENEDNLEKPIGSDSVR